MDIQNLIKTKIPIHRDTYLECIRTFCPVLTFG